MNRLGKTKQFTFLCLAIEIYLTASLDLENIIVDFAFKMQKKYIILKVIHLNFNINN